MIRWSLRKLPNGEYEGLVTLVPASNVPMPRRATTVHARRGAAAASRIIQKGKPINLVATSSTKEGALLKAASVASKIANNPIMQAALPPGSSQAIKAVQFLAKSGAAGTLKSAAKKIVGPGAKRLAKALKFW